MFNILSSGLEGAKELGVFIFPIYSLFNGEPRSYLEFPNHLTGVYIGFNQQRGYIGIRPTIIDRHINFKTAEAMIVQIFMIAPFNHTVVSDNRAPKNPMIHHHFTP